MYAVIRVAEPKQIGNTPSTLGSSVPVCPIFFIRKILRNLNTQSWDVIPFSFHNGKIPCIYITSFSSPIPKRKTFIPLTSLYITNCFSSQKERKSQILLEIRLPFICLTRDFLHSLVEVMIEFCCHIRLTHQTQT